MDKGSGVLLQEHFRRLIERFSYANCLAATRTTAEANGRCEMSFRVPNSSSHLLLAIYYKRMPRDHQSQGLVACSLEFFCFLRN